MARKVLIAAGAAAAIAGLLFGLRDVRQRSSRSDFTVYVVAGAAMLDGRDPYEVTNPRGWHYVYPPLFGMVVSPLGRFSPQTQVSVWFWICLVLGLLCAAECRRLVRVVAKAEGPPERAGRWPPWIPVLAALAVLPPALDTVQRGQVGLAIILLLLLGFGLGVQRRPWPGAFLGGIMLAAPIAVKLTPSLPVGFLVARWMWVSARGNERGFWSGRGMAVASGVVAGLLMFVFVIPGALLGWGRNLDLLQIWAGKIAISARHGSEGDNLHLPRNQSASNAVEMFNRWVPPGAPPAPASPRDPIYPDLLAQPRVNPAFVRLVVWGVRLAALALLVLAGLRLGTRNDPLGEGALFGLACTTTLVISPVAWGHHYVIALPALLFVPLWLWRRGARAAAWWLSVAPPALIGVHYLAIDSNLIYRPLGRSLTWTIGLLGVGIAVWCLAACSLMLRLAGRDASAERLPPPPVAGAGRAASSGEDPRTLSR